MEELAGKFTEEERMKIAEYMNELAEIVSEKGGDRIDITYDLKNNTSWLLRFQVKLIKGDLDEGTN